MLRSRPGAWRVLAGFAAAALLAVAAGASAAQTHDFGLYLPPHGPGPPAAADTPPSPEESGSEEERPAVTVSQRKVAWFEELAPVEIPPDEQLAAEGARVGEIFIVVGDIFDPEDPKENKALYRLVNKFHITTHDWVIRQQLLIEPGDPFDRRLLEESERLLRTNRYLFDASVRPVNYEDGKVDVEVTARDVWTLTGGANFARSGGENTISFNIQDVNLLGTGKDLTVRRKSDVDRTTSEVLYRDRNLTGRRVVLELKVADNSDGHRRVAKLERPFYALDSRWTAGIVGISDDRIGRIFEEGQAQSEFRHQNEFLEVYWGRSRGFVEGRSLRWRLGFTYLADRFAAIPERPAPDPLPPDKTLSYPWIEVGRVTDRFIEVIDLDRIARTEDLNLGSHFQVRAGWSSPTTGGDRDQGLFGCSAGRGFKPAESQLILTSLNCGARYARGKAETALVNGRAKFFWRNLGDKHLFFTALEADYARDLDAEQQLLLGGDSGLRGYPQRFQAGNRRYLVTLEQRFYTNWEPFQLFNVGAAVFFDAGRAWIAGANDPGDLGILKDAGFGLRLSPSRSGRGTLLHFDVAFPLDGTADIDSVQWLVTTKETF